MRRPYYPHASRYIATVIVLFGIVLVARYCLPPIPTQRTATVWPSDGTAANIQALHDNSAQAGDTITLPAGTFTWSTQVAISKAITLQGVGVGITVVRDNVQGPPFLFATGGGFRITGIEFRDGGRVNVAFAPNGAFKVAGAGFRLDHCKFDHIRGAIVSLDGINSVIDQNEFRFIGNMYIAVYNSNYGGVPWGDGSQFATTSFGSEQFAFIESNTLAHDTGEDYAQVDAFHGARYVARYNTCINGRFGGHGTEGQRGRGMRAVEVYNNTWNNDTTGLVGHARGGIVLYWGNRVNGATNGRIDLECHRVSFGSAIWGLADGTSVWDVNQNGVLVHAIDQPGRCRGSLITGGNPPNRPPTWNDQVTEPCYSWDNQKADGTPINFSTGEANVREGEHYINGTPMPGYLPYTYPHPLRNEQQPSPTPTATATATATPTATATATPTPTATATATPTATATATATATPTAAPIILTGQRVELSHGNKDKVILNWTGATGANVAIRINGDWYLVVPNTGTYTFTVGDNDPPRTYQIYTTFGSCPCSNIVTL